MNHPLDPLVPQDREVHSLLLKFLKGFSAKEIGEKLGLECGVVARSIRALTSHDMVHSKNEKYRAIEPVL